MSNMYAVPEETISDNNMTALAKVEKIKKQVETLETFLSSNPFLKELAKYTEPGMIYEDDMDTNVLIGVCFERNERWITFMATDDGNILGRLAPCEDWPIKDFSFAPTDTEAVIKFLVECGYFNGHEAMEAMESPCEDQARAIGEAEQKE